MCSPLIGHVLNILLLREFETAWCGTLGDIPRTLNSHQNYKWNFHYFTHTPKKPKNKKSPPQTNNKTHPPKNPTNLKPKEAAEQKQICMQLHI